MDSVRQSGTALSWGRLANAHSDGWLPGNRFRTTTRCTEESKLGAPGRNTKVFVRRDSLGPAPRSKQ